MSLQATLIGSVVLPSESEMLVAGVPEGTARVTRQLPLVPPVQVFEVTQVAGVALTEAVAATWTVKGQEPE